jgi:arylsulfatase A-like enzyme
MDQPSRSILALAPWAVVLLLAPYPAVASPVMAQPGNPPVASPRAPSPERPPNFVVIFLDDAGWADYPPFGDPPYPTPHVERLAQEGTRFDNFYVPQAVCSASRAALMTGAYPGRTRVFGAHPPRARGLDPKFATLGEVLQGRGYATAVFGKWHLGDQPDTRPPARGFAESSGLMYSNDMWEHHRRFYSAQEP